jgi:pimeloyl-ACP methyl ester carboxylesterase
VGKKCKESMNHVEKFEFRVASSQDDLCLAVRRRTGNEGLQRPPVLFVHGATYASTLTFDYANDGPSWMTELADAGFDVWCVDLLGYGASDRPPEMAAPAEENPPLVDTAQAERDVHLVINFIRSTCAVPRVSLIGYSWGTAIAGGVAAARPEVINRLVLYGALWLKDVPSAITSGAPPLAYREVTVPAMLARWVTGLNATEQDSIGDHHKRERWAASVLASDPDPSDGTLRAPAGVVRDVVEKWSQGMPTYDPTNIQAPTLIVVGEWDHETTPAQGREVFARLVHAAERRYLMIGRATHSMLLERQAPVLRAAVQAFLSES